MNQKKTSIIPMLFFTLLPILGVIYFVLWGGK
jgi:hypothetical protein